MKAYNKQQEEIQHIKSELSSVSFEAEAQSPGQNSLHLPVHMPTWSNRPNRSKRSSTRWRLQDWWKRWNNRDCYGSTLKTSGNCHLPSLRSATLPSPTLAPRRITCIRVSTLVSTWIHGTLFVTRAIIITELATGSPSSATMEQANRPFSTSSLALSSPLKAQYHGIPSSNLPNTPNIPPINCRMINPQWSTLLPCTRASFQGQIYSSGDNR